MVTAHDLVVDLSACDKHDTRYVGGKNANLGEMIAAGFPVPGGFAITSTAYFEFLKQNNLQVQIKHLLGTVNYESTDSLSQVSRHIKKLIISSPVPEHIVKDIFKAYLKLGGDPLVAVRSSATSEDSKDASFAGQQETFLNVKGEAVLIEKVREAWASLFQARAIYYRHDAKMDHLKTGISLVVQRMVQSESSGVMFTIDPVTNNKNKIVIEAIFGLGEYIVQGIVTPDHYEVSKFDYLILEKLIRVQKVAYVKHGVENKEIKLSEKEGGKQKITDSDITELAHLAKKLEDHYYFPQDIEWAKEKDTPAGRQGKLYIVQTRPITTTEKKEEQSAVGTIPEKDAEKMLMGDPASPGIGIGKVKIIRSLSDGKDFEKGMVLVARATNPDYVPLMKKAAAIITEAGGRTSHAAIVSREFGIPAVVGTPMAMSRLKDGMMVTVHGSLGFIYKGSVMLSSKKEQTLNVDTVTKLYVNLAEPELAARIAARHVDGVGLLRAEFMIAQIGKHPKKFIEEGKQQEFINRLADDLSAFCKAFYPRPVLYRATDFKTNEYRSLVGGKHFEPEESNPMLGYRGAYRYIHDPRVFNLELEAIKKVREKLGLVNLRLMLPFVRTVKDLRDVKKLIADAGLKRSHTFKLFMMAEIPSNVILIDKFIEEGIDGVSIGSNDLTMLTLGVDRDNAEVATEFDERDPAVLWSLERVIRACRENNIEIGICGQAPSEYPDLVEDLVKWGIYSISVSPDAIDRTRRIIHTVEKKIAHKLK